MHASWEDGCVCFYSAFSAHDYVEARTMAAKPAQVSRVRELVDELVAMVGGRWAATIDQPFIISGCTERTVIFELHFRMEVGGNEPVVMRDDVIGLRLRWDEVLRAMVLAKRDDEGPSFPSREQELTSEDEDAKQVPLGSTVSDSGGEVERREVKRVVDWTSAIEELRRKRRRGKGREDDPNHRC